MGSLAAAGPALAHDGWGGGGPGGGRHTLWASPDGGGGRCSAWAPCSVTNAVATAAAGDTVLALPGTYDGGVVLDKQLTLKGWGTVINASTSPNGNGVQIVGPGGSA